MIEFTEVGAYLFVRVGGETSKNSFRELVQRATNLWPDATPEIKEFADQVTNPELLDPYKKQKGLQNYYSQDTSPSAGKVRRLFYCSLCKSENLVDLSLFSHEKETSFTCSHCRAHNVVSSFSS